MKWGPGHHFAGISVCPSVPCPLCRSHAECTLQEVQRHSACLCGGGRGVGRERLNHRATAVMGPVWLGTRAGHRFRGGIALLASVIRGDIGYFSNTFQTSLVGYLSISHDRR